MYIWNFGDRLDSVFGKDSASFATTANKLYRRPQCFLRNIGGCGLTRQIRIGFPNELVVLKPNSKRMEWDTLGSVIREGVNCVWLD